MKCLLTLFCAIYISTFQVFAQDTVKTNSIVKTNPIIFGEVFFGFTVAGISGIQGGYSLNYQIKSNLITVRATQIDDVKLTVIAPIIPIPILIDQGYANEYAVLYGLRSIKEGHSLSFSLGISQNTRVVKYNDHKRNFLYQTSSSYVGISYEFNIKWFKKNKERYRIYYVIPVGKSTSFGNSVGLKLSGNLSKNSYLAFGITLGLGFHKHY